MVEGFGLKWWQSHLGQVGLVLGAREGRERIGGDCAGGGTEPILVESAASKHHFQCLKQENIYIWSASTKQATRIAKHTITPMMFNKVFPHGLHLNASIVA